MVLALQTLEAQWMSLQRQSPDCVPVVAELCLCSDQTEVYQRLLSLDLLSACGAVNLAEMRVREREGGGGRGEGEGGGEQERLKNCLIMTKHLNYLA